MHPTIGGLPWLEKPPLPWWLVAALGSCAGGVTETIARFPSVVAATAIVIGVAIVAARHYGLGIGLLAGAVQATTTWTVTRGRLAEGDILLACLITWTMVAFDWVLGAGVSARVPKQTTVVARKGTVACWAFFALLGSTALVKGTGFGAVLIMAIVAVTLLWRRDLTALRQLCFPAGWVLAIGLALAWPLFMLTRYGFKPLTLWTMHIADRLAVQAGPGPFAGERWWEYVAGLLGQALPWTPLAFLGAYGSINRVVGRKRPGSRGHTQTEILTSVIAGDCLLCAWAIAPLGLLALATVKNAHYAISAQVPWSIWAALGLAQVGCWLQRRGCEGKRLRLAAQAGFLTLALGYGTGYWLLGPWLDRRGLEWAFYESAGHQLAAGAPLALLYDDWDRNPYESPFGPIPHDLAVRLFYLHRPACWHIAPDSLAACAHEQAAKASSIPASSSSDPSPDASHVVLGVIARDRDRAALERLGHVEVIARGPRLRSDRTYVLFQVISDSEAVRSMRAFGGRAN